MNAFQPTIVAASLSTIERRACHVLSIALIALVGVYIYFTGAMIMHAVAGQEAARASEEVSSQIAAHEKEYFALINALTINRATELGLTPVSDKHFVTRTVRLGTVHGTGDEI